MSAQSKIDAAVSAALERVKLWGLGLVIMTAVLFVAAAAIGLGSGGERFAASRLDAVTVMVNVGGGHGSGVVIGDGTLVLTARHVVDGSGGRVQIQTKDGRTYDGTVLWSGDPNGSDVALVRIEGGRLPAADLRCDPTEVGEPIEVVGHPLDIPWTHTYGRVSNSAQEVEGAEYLQTDANAYFGNSGGPAFDSDGRVVGILVLIYTVPGGSPWLPAPIGISWIVPAPQICEMLAGGVVR